MNDIRPIATSLRAVGQAVRQEWNDKTADRFQKDVVAELVTASLSLAASAESAEAEIRAARRDL